MRVTDLLSTNFTVLHESLTASEARARLTGGRLGVVVDDDGTPRALVTAEDLCVAARGGGLALRETAAALPRTMVVELGRDAPELCEEHLRYLIDSGAHGIVAVDRGRSVAGVIPVCSMFTSTVGLSGGLMSLGVAGSLAGTPNTEPLARNCLTCEYLNHLHYLDDNVAPLCQNPVATSHKLVFQA
jgi:hypothetical protein